MLPLRSMRAALAAVATIVVSEFKGLLIAGYAAHGVKDPWQHRTRFVAGTRWWPPFCATIDFLVAAILAREVAHGMSFD